MRVAVLMPSKGRAGQLERNAGGLLLQPLPAGVEQLLLVLAIEGSDHMTLSVGRKFQHIWRETENSVSIVVRPDNTTCVQGFNMAYERARNVADWYVLGSDDQVWAFGWLAEALAVADATGAQVIGLNDLHTDLSKYAPHFMVAGAYIEKHMHGYIVPPIYKSWWFDREICERAAAMGLYAPAWGAVVEHQHPDWQTAQMDETYREAWPLHDTDKLTYMERQGVGYEG